MPFEQRAPGLKSIEYFVVGHVFGGTDFSPCLRK